MDVKFKAMHYVPWGHENHGRSYELGTIPCTVQLTEKGFVLLVSNKATAAILKDAFEKIKVARGTDKRILAQKRWRYK